MRQKKRTGRLSTYLICTLILDLIFVLTLIFLSSPPDLKKELQYIFNDYITWSTCLWDYFLLCIIRFIASFFSLCGTRQRILTYLGAALQCIYFIIKFIVMAAKAGIDQAQITRILLVLEGLVFVILESAIIERIFKHTARRLVFHAQQKKPLLQDHQQQQQQGEIVVEVPKDSPQTQTDSEDENEQFVDARSDVTNSSFHSALSFKSHHSSSSQSSYWKLPRRALFFYRS